MKYLLFLLFPVLLVGLTTQNLSAQWAHNFQKQMEVPGIVEIESSPAHFYVLSESEGLAVFRAHADSLQWLYTSTGMQRRGTKMVADVRFAYLYGDSRRLTIIEPTSVLGVYSSTVLPEVPKSVQRLGNDLYIAIGQTGLISISLETPESVDSEPTILNDETPIRYLASDNHSILYALSGNRSILIYEKNRADGGISYREEVQLSRSLEKIFLTDNELIGTDSSGRIYLIDSDGQLQELGNVQSPIDKLSLWRDHLVVRASGTLWIGKMEENLIEWKKNSQAGNHFAVVENQLWVSEYNTLSPVVESRQTVRAERDESNNSDRPHITLKEISDMTLPFPRPLLLPLEIESTTYSIDEITFSYTGSVNDAKIRGNTLFWQPRASQTGRQTFKLLATTADGMEDSVEFTVDFRPFNSPPRFAPTRPITVPVEEPFEFEIEAFDPDGGESALIRFLGVDLPSGANLNERTGLFRWTPNIRQVGTYSFQVIATDQYGAAASQDFELRVIEIETEQNIEDTDQ